MALCRQLINISRRLLTPQSKLSILFTDRRCIKRWVAPTLRELKRRRDKIGPEPERPRSSFLEWNYSAEVYAFANRLNEHFDTELLTKALNNEINKDLVCDGDHFLKVCVREQVRKYLSSYPDEAVQAVRDSLVSEENLAYVASHIGLRDIIICKEFPVPNNILVSTFKSILAALIQSSGENCAEKLVGDLITVQLSTDNGREAVEQHWHIEYPMKMLEQLIGEQPEARLCNHCAGKTILAAYQVGLYKNDKQQVGTGWGETIDTAVDVAARDALRRLFTDESRKNH